MTRHRHFRHPLAIATLATLLLLGASGAVHAQLRTGNLHGSVKSDASEPLPGVTVELSGLGAVLTQVTDGQGQFRLLGLAPGTYRLAASLEGFSPVVHEAVTVAVGRNTTIAVTMLWAIEEVISVTSESPLLDERKISAGATVTQTELEEIPSARDPWVVVQSVPGVLTRDVNVGGNKSGFQQGFTGNGSFDWNNTYAVDGVVISDVAAGNSSPTYYDFEAFREIEVSTGGSDVSLISGGVTLNMVTKRGTNERRISARYLVADDAWQASLAPAPSDLGRGQDQFTQGNRIVKIEEYGIEGGGPLVRDRLWGWGFFGRNDIDRLTIDDVRDFSELENYGLKLNSQLTRQNSIVALFHYGNKVVAGRGASPTRPQPTTLNQDGPTSIYKLDDTHIFGSQLFLTGLVSYVDGGFRLTPQGGVDGLNAVLDAAFIWQNNYYWFDGDRDQEQGTLDGSYFFTTGEIDHEIKFGAGYRRAETFELFGWPGDAVRLDFYRGFGYPYNVAEISRRETYAYSTEYTSLFAQDTLRFGRLTVNVGVRFDRQVGQLDSASVPAVPGFEELPDGTPLLPAVAYDGKDQEFPWEDVSPRLGLTYAMDEGRKTLLRLSYSRFAAQLDQWYAYLEWPLGPSSAGFFYEDANGDERVTVDEIIGFEYGPLYTNGYDPLAQSGLYDIDPGFDAGLSDELILGVEHAVMPELVVGLSATWRNQRRLEEYERLVLDGGVVRPHRRSDYELLYTQTVLLPDGSSSDVEVWGLRDGIEETGRMLLTNGDRETDFLGLNLTVHKRLSKRWMLRGHVSWSDFTWRVPESELEDPNVRNGWWGQDDDGGPVYTYPITPGWSYRLGGLVQIAPDRTWGFHVAGNLWGRQGYATDYYVTAYDVFETEPRLALQAVRPLDRQRLPSVRLLDLRIEKPIQLGDFGLSFAVEAFNVLNESTVLRRNNRLEAASAGWVQEVMNPRVFRLSTRLSFR